MNAEHDPALVPPPPPVLPLTRKIDRRNAVTLKLLFIAGLVLLLQGPLYQDYALLAGTGALFAALAAVMFFTRNIDWQAEDAPPAPTATPERAR